MILDVSIISKIAKEHGVNGFYMIVMVVFMSVTLNHIKETNTEDRHERVKERERNEVLTKNLIDLLISTNKAIERNNLVLERSDQMYISEELETLSQQTLKLTDQNLLELSRVKQKLDFVKEDTKRSLQILEIIKDKNR